MNDLSRRRLEQGKQSLDEAQALLDAGMDTGFVLTNIYYAFYYPVLALLNRGEVPETMQSVTLGLFEQRYIKTGKIPQKYYDAVRRVFDIKPKCGGEKTPVSREELDSFMATAREFSGMVGHLPGT